MQRTRTTAAEELDWDSIPVPRAHSRRSGWHPSGPSTHRPVGLTKTHRHSKMSHDRDVEHGARLNLRRAREHVAVQLSSMASDIDDHVSWVMQVFGRDNTEGRALLEDGVYALG